MLASWIILLATLPVRAGEYFTEEISNPSIAVIHGWRHQDAALEMTITNSDIGTFSVPWEVNRDTCERLEFRLSDGSSVSFTPEERCTASVFSQLDKLINLQVTELVVVSNGTSESVSLAESDQVALANVANLSRNAFVLFQQEVARALGQAPAAAPTTPDAVPAPPPPLSTQPETPPIPIINTAATPTPAPPAPPPPAQSGTFDTGTVTPTAGQLVIVGDIREEFVSAGSQLTVEAINTGTTAVLSAQARFQFFSQDRIVDNRIAAFTPSDVSPGTTATATVLKTDQNWDRVSVSFIWAEP